MSEFDKTAYPRLRFALNTEANEYHLFPSKLNNGNCVAHLPSICSAIDSKTGIKLYDGCYTDSTARTKAAEMQNSGLEVCGNCVRILYRTED